jgi:hypothetical protein
MMRQGRTSFGRHAARVAAAGAVALAGCSAQRGDAERAGGAIAFGTADTAHTAVVAILGEVSGGFTECSGTIVQVTSGHADVLTAAHCCSSGAPSIVVVASDYTVGEQYLGTATAPAPPAYAVMPGSVYYDAAYDGQGAHDFCMLEIPAPGAAAIPVAVGTDGLTVGSPIQHVGFGITDVNQNNSTRRVANDVLDQGLTATALTFSEGGASHVGGPCEGDSGGPVLVPPGSPQAQQTLVAVESFGNSASCAQVTAGVASRVLSATGPGGFITSYLAGTPTGTNVGGTLDAGTADAGAGPDAGGAGDAGAGMPDAGAGTADAGDARGGALDAGDAGDGSPADAAAAPADGHPDASDASPPEAGGDGRAGDDAAVMPADGGLADGPRPDASGPGNDAAVDAATGRPAASSGCSCSATPTRPPAGGLAALLVVACALASCRRRPRAAGGRLRSAGPSTRRAARGRARRAGEPPSGAA